jgi:hypothetical protein
MPLLPVNINRPFFFGQIKGHNSGTEKSGKVKIEHGLLYLVLDLAFKFQMICLRGTEAIRQKPNVGCTDMGRT